MSDQIWTELYFMREAQFFAGIGPAIFRIVRRAIEAHVSNPFSPHFLVIFRFCFRFVEMVAAKIQHFSDITKCIYFTFGQCERMKL